MPDAIVTRRQKILGLIAVLLGQFMLILDATVVHVALPAMQKDLVLAPAELTWITNSYLIAFGGLLLLFGRLGDQYGRRRILLLGLAVFTVASVACGFAPSALSLIVARFVQGAGAAAAASVILAIIATEFPAPAERARAMSGYMFVSVSGGSLGLFVGGLLTQFLSWHWIFLINVPFGLLAIHLARKYIREERPASSSGRLDIAGAILVTAAAMLVIYGLVAAARTSWTSTEVRASFALAVVLGVLFFWIESLVENPLLPLRMLRIKSLVVTSVVRGFMAMGLYGVFFFATLDMSHTLGFGPLGGGLAFLPLLTLAMEDVPQRDAGLGSAIVNLSQQLAAAVSVAVLVTAASTRTRSLADTGESLVDATVHGYRFAYLIAIVGLLVGVTLAGALLRNRDRASAVDR